MHISGPVWVLVVVEVCFSLWGYFWGYRNGKRDRK